MDLIDLQCYVMPDISPLVNPSQWLHLDKIKHMSQINLLELNSLIPVLGDTTDALPVATGQRHEGQNKHHVKMVSTS